MEQFAIYRLKPGKSGARRPLLAVVLQHRLAFGSGTVVVAPLRPENELPAIGRLRPGIALGDVRYRAIVDRLNVIAESELQELMGTAQHLRDELKRALDELFFGV